MIHPDVERLKQEILERTRQLISLRQSGETFEPGASTVPYAGRVFDADEVAAGVGSMLDFWLTLGPEGAQFERSLSRFLDVRRSVLVNSGSSANLVAMSAICSFRLGERRVAPGDEVITAAAGFPTTVAPILQAGAVPVFVDSDPVTGNLLPGELEAAFSPRTRAVMAAHTLGNPFDLTAVSAFCRKHGLWLIEDNCDALGSRYGERLTGSFGDLSTQSFYPPHHITMGEGGAVNVVREAALIREVEAIRDWGRDCWCPSGQDNTCGKRYDWELGELPPGYDHKYIYSHLGYNLKPIDPQAAIGRVQLEKLPRFVEARASNWQYLRHGLADLEEFFEFMLPTHAKAWRDGEFEWTADAPRVSPSWFGFMLLVRPSAPFDRTGFARLLEEARIGNRMLFGGNLVRQPAFVRVREESGGRRMGIVGPLAGADRLMRESVFVGTYPGLKKPQLDYMIDRIHAAVKRLCGESRPLAFSQGGASD
jgi:CDP-6-deoxy-D-xylo-4-hexulose-3-dehydrase